MDRTQKSLNPETKPVSVGASQAGQPRLPVNANASVATSNQVLVFEVADQAYGLPLDSVVQVTGLVAITRLPQSPEVVVGVVDFASRIIPVVDARRRLRQPDRPYTLYTPLIIGQLSGFTMALAVDALVGVRPLRPEQIQTPSQILTPDMALKVEHLIGAARLGDGLVLVLDPNTFLSAEENASLDKAIEALEKE